MNAEPKLASPVEGLVELLKLKRPLIAADLETTGVRYAEDRIVQIGLCKLYPNGDYTEWETLVRPGIPIPKEAAAVHFIDDIRVNSCKRCGGVQSDTPVTSQIETKADDGLSLRIVETIYQPCSCATFHPWPMFHDIAPTLHKGFQGCDFCGYNFSGFDVRFLAASFARANIVWPPPKMVDGFKIWMRVAPRNLRVAVRDYLGEELLDAHSALADSRAALKLIPALLQRHPELPRSVDELHAMFFETPREGCLDPDGKLVWRDKEAAFNFGKYEGKTLREAIARDRKYVEWVCGTTANFSDIVKQILGKALRGEFPVRA